MERIGERLRRRREELGFTIDDISKSTRYRPEIIRAVEEGRAGVFPAEAYNHAFLRAYAERLKLDPAEIVREQKSEEERIHDALRGIRTKPARPANLRRTLVWLAVIVGVAAAFLLLYDRVIKPRVTPAGSVEAGARGGGESESPGMFVPDSTREAAPADSEGAGAGSGESGAGEQAEMDEVSVRVPTGDSGDARENREAGPGGRSCLEVSITGHAVKARVFAGDSLIINGWLRSGFRDVFCSSKPFWADTIVTQADAMLLVLNGEKVDLPDARDNVITDFRISP
jgi:transcriptional regulator with XRE-family HTH domain